MKRVTCVCLAFTSLLLQCYFLFLLQKQSVYIRKLHEAQPEDVIVVNEGQPNTAVSLKVQSSKVLALHDVTQQLTTPVLDKNCTVPDDWLYPLCAYKVEWLQNFWKTNSKCYVDRHGMDPFDICSVLEFLSEVEAWCPIMPWRKHVYSNPSGDKVRKEQVPIRTELDDLFQKNLNHSKYLWMRERITRLWPDWTMAAKTLQAESPTLRNRQSKKIFLFMGTYSIQVDWLANAYKGVPLGEMVQWSDLIASLYALGHDITISAEQPSMKKILNAPSEKGCGRRLRQKEFDLIFTDYLGAWLLGQHLGPTVSHYRCRLRILDSFGTDPEFNYAEYKHAAKFKTGWGKPDVHVRQMMTMFPHSPDNLFLGFVVDKASNEDAEGIRDKETKSNKPIGVLYAKDAMYLQGRGPYLDTLNKYLEIHATIANEKNISKDAIKKFVPKYVVNHGIMKGADLKKLLRESKLNPPQNRENSGFFRGKPTFRALTSQHPYMETFIKKPHVYTIDINDLGLVEASIKEIVSRKVTPYLPYEWTTNGMLERVNMFTEKLNFCEHDEQWPPLKEMHIVLGSQGSSCKDACGENGFLCEPSFFNNINTVKEFEKIGITCKTHAREETLVEPSYNPSDQTCTIQAMSLIFSCVAKDSPRRRLCPCRDYQPEQVAFCKNCR
ncbi:unnamed protein product [Porites lobata]|uniref:alpha-1,6-mannosyl-glycoprotein 6-beta-N-acetylglucosaminyltransferase n=1 Tax=Porites lobata TaxID=104759 RepID=A0ABN8RAM8_9CNID|nr:unnamed protein product [Porites lobata]